MKMKIVPIRADFIHKTRNAGLDDQNQPVVRSIAVGGEPCRDVLRRARPGEEILLASYCPFSVPGPYKEYGAVFLLANEPEQQPDYSRFPLPTGSDTDYLGETLVLRAYNSSEQIVDAHVTTPAEAEAMLGELFANLEVTFVLTRFVAYGCYGFRIERDL